MYKRPVFKRPVQPALQLRLRLGGTDVRDSAARFRDRLFRGNQESAGARLAGRPSFVWRRVCDKLTYAGARAIQHRVPLCIPAGQKYSSEAPSLES
jgi:hypothetical protein